jgi:hypothetical protein
MTRELPTIRVEVPSEMAALLRRIASEELTTPSALARAYLRIYLRQQFYRQAKTGDQLPVLRAAPRRRGRRTLLAPKAKAG